MVVMTAGLAADLQAMEIVIAIKVTEFLVIPVQSRIQMKIAAQIVLHDFLDQAYQTCRQLLLKLCSFKTFQVARAEL
jgi:hypothetical protein